MKWTLLAAACWEISASTAAHGADVRVGYCNFAPYDTEAIFIEQNGTEAKLLASKVLPAGSCDAFSVAGGSENTNLAYYIRALDSRAFRRLRQDAWFEAEWDGWPIWSAPNIQNAACVSINGEFISPAIQGDCGDSLMIGNVPVIVDASGQFFLESSDPYMCAEEIGVDCDEELNPTLYWAFFLSRSLEASYMLSESERGNLHYGVIPTALGWEAIDHNGPYQMGVLVNFAYDKTPFGSGIHIRPGDIILEFNGNPVFDRNDLVYYTLEHGLNGGYEAPHRIFVQRGNEQILFEGYQVFNRGAYEEIFLNYDGTCRNTGGASLTGALRESSFYTSDILGCLNFDRNNNVTRNRRCEFIVKQVVAAYRQFCPNETFYATIVGSVFMPGREIPENLLRRFAFRGVSVAPRMMRAMVLEGMEEAARAVQTLPPGIEAMNSLKDIRDAAAFSAGVGIGFTVAFPRGLF